MDLTNNIGVWRVLFLVEVVVGLRLLDSVYRFLLAVGGNLLH